MRERSKEKKKCKYLRKFTQLGFQLNSFKRKSQFFRFHFICIDAWKTLLIPSGNDDDANDETRIYIFASFIEMRVCNLNFAWLIKVIDLFKSKYDMALLSLSSCDVALISCSLSNGFFFLHSPAIDPSRYLP